MARPTSNYDTTACVLSNDSCGSGSTPASNRRLARRRSYSLFILSLHLFLSHVGRHPLLAYYNTCSNAPKSDTVGPINLADGDLCVEVHMCSDHRIIGNIRLPLRFVTACDCIYDIPFFTRRFAGTVWPPTNNGTPNSCIKVRVTIR